MSILHCVTYLLSSMIEQFMEITGVGRFKNCTPSGNTCFGKNTVIF